MVSRAISPCNGASCSSAVSSSTTHLTLQKAAPSRLRCRQRQCLLSSAAVFPGANLVVASRRRPFLIRANLNWSSDAQTEGQLQDLTSWLKQQGLPDQVVELKQSGTGGIGCFSTRPLQAGECAIKIPENFTVTCADVANHPVISQLATGRPDIIGLALWLMYEKSLGEKSVWYPYVKTFPSTTLSPITWSKSEQETLLKGTSVAEEVNQRCLFLEDEFSEIMETSQSKLMDLPQSYFTVDAFKNAFAVILSRAIYLPSAELYALVPIADAVNVTGKCEASFEYSSEYQAVVLRVDKGYTLGQQVFASYGQNRPNSDLLISYGFVDENNNSDFIEVEVELVNGDPLRTLKSQILQMANFQDGQSFPLYLDRFPTQLLSYMRLARLQDAVEFAKIVFDRDIIVSEANEYEVLTLLLTDCRNRLSSFEESLDDNIRLLNRKDISEKERVAAKLRVCEQRILSNTMSALRNRLAPIRGVPTKGGAMKDRHSDIKEMFGVMEDVASAPRKFMSNFMKGKE
ncbi:hypothetical protein GOP47_0015827 [Adiantum capillus-veneris]|uniref:Rubisco LSMT substrate-binding domain-containing protein n=1 Tax=Adiantum capillus-veneris TaxID=13818 RepID=A0A9D4ULB4_ADICA|nr:hypothetical protein GOP47_0015827 [Adiantum capillus-veneris]